MLVAVVLIVAGCGIPTEDHAATAGPEEVPFGLLTDEPRQPPATAVPPAGPTVEIYLLEGGGDRLAAVRRTIEEADISDVIAALLAGPSDVEADRGLSSALPEGDVVQSLELSGGVAAVDLSPVFGVLDGTTQKLAIAQLVYTLTARPGIGRISFTLSGQPVEIPRGDGALTSGSVSRDSYRELAPTA